jgi:uncharacterized protein YegJ (DUF2314 family)
MTRTLTALALMTALIGCEPSGSTSTTMSSDTKPTLTPVQSDDAEMLAAMQTARDRFPEFWREVSADYKRVIPALGGSMVKAYFYDAAAPQSGEHMWVSEVEYDGKTITGVLADTPRQLRSVRSGQQVSFPLERLSDWFYVDGGKAIGAFTVRLLRTRMTAEQRQAHDSHYPFRFE